MVFSFYSFIFFFILSFFSFLFSYFISGCKPVEKQYAPSFKNLTYYVNKETYFSVQEGIYENGYIKFSKMKVIFKDGYSYIESGTVDLKNLVIKPNSALPIYTSSFIVKIQKDPIIKLRKFQIEGYQAVIKTNQAENKERITKANKIIINLLENKIYTFENRGSW